MLGWQLWKIGRGGKEKSYLGDVLMKFLTRINCESYRRPWEHPSVFTSISWRRGVVYADGFAAGATAILLAGLFNAGALAFLGFGARRAGWSSGWQLNFAWSWGAERSI
jgi:hypothetical protein